MEIFCTCCCLWRHYRIIVGCIVWLAYNCILGKLFCRRWYCRNSGSDIISFFNAFTHPNQSLTVWNAASSQYALNVMLYVGVVLLVIILAYKIFAYNTIWHKKPTLNANDIEKDEHAFY